MSDVVAVKVECRGCQAYVPVDDPPGHGQCRRHPPQVVGFLVPRSSLTGGQFEQRLQSHFPLVAAEAGCLDFLPHTQATGEEQSSPGLRLVR